MTNRKTAVDRAFDQKIRDAVEVKDWDRVVKVFSQYGSYLELMEANPKKVEDAQVPTDS